MANALGTLAILLVVGLFVAVAIPQVVGADHSYVVRSSSMAPAMDAGAVVFVADVPAEQVEEGDVVTVRRSTQGTTVRVTHRVVEVVERNGQPHFRTKGDANDSPDPGLASPAQLVGVVGFSIPLIGYVVAFTQTTVGVLVLVVVPAVLLALSEVYSLLAATDGEGADGGEVS